MPKRFTKEDDALLSELGVETKVTKTAKYTAREERIIAGFEEIQRFVEEHGRCPEHGEDRDIFERLYAVRLDRLRSLEECKTLLEKFDTDDLLSGAKGKDAEIKLEPATDDELLAALGVESIPADDVSQLQHVRSRDEIKTAEEIARRTPCEGFEQFQPVFEQVQRELKNGDRRTAKYQDHADINQGDLFILDGQKVLIAAMGDPFVTDYGRKDRRLRVIYDNGTESDLLLRSLQRALYKDSNSRRILDNDSTTTLPLFADEIEADDACSGHIYVARSLSDHPFIVEHREVLHKIGVTSQDLKRRISNAKKDPTFLLADVELVESYRLANMNRRKLEQLLHQFFGAARIDLQLRDRFDEKVEPKEWFLVPLPIIRRAIELLMSGEIENSRYDIDSAEIIDVRANDVY